MHIAIAIPGFSLDPRSNEGKETLRAIKQCASVVGSARVNPGVVVFGIEGAFAPHVSGRKNAKALETLLACLCELNRIWLKYHPNTMGLYDTPVYYDRTLVWDTIPALYRRGFGDCKSLSAARVAQLRAAGIWCTPVFRFKARPHSTLYHILIMFQDGSWECPSALLGMHAYQEDPGAPQYMHRRQSRQSKASRFVGNLS